MVKVHIKNKVNGLNFFKVARSDIKLSDFRIELEKNDEINDKLSFSQKFDDDDVEISRVNEDDFMLEDFTEGSNEIDIIDMHLVKATTTYWKFLNKLNQLDRGWVITSEGIKRANEQALILHSAKIEEVNARKHSAKIEEGNARKEVTVSYEYKKEMKRFYITDKNVPNFAGLSKKNYKNASPSKYTVYEKARFEIDKLKASKTFIKDVEVAIKDETIKSFKDIIERYGQFIPTKIIFGSRTETNYCRQWDFVEFQEQKSVFHFVDACLREKIYSIFGKKILYSLITIENDDRVNDVDEENIDDNYNVKKIKLPPEVSNIISNNADCSIFATAVGMNYCYHCQILTSPGKEPELMVHCLKKRSDDTEILIRWIVIGYDTYLKSIFSKNEENINLDESMKLEVLRKHYMPYDERKNKMFELLDSSDYYYVGIPVVDKKDSLIGHCFSNDYKELHTFAYSLREKRCERLPKFSFNVLAIPKCTFKEQIKFFEKRMNDGIITVGKYCDGEIKNFPKFISLCFNKSEQILLKQRLAHITVKFLDKNSSKISARDFKCLFFIPFERYFFCTS